MPTIMPRVIQQVDINDVPLVIQEHRGHPGWCSHCQKVYEAIARIDARPGGQADHRDCLPQGVCHASSHRPQIRSRCSQADIAATAKSCKVSQALEQPYQELLENLPDQKWLNVDETGHKQNRLRQWTWCFRASLYTLFKIDPTRSADVLIEVLARSLTGCWAATISRPIGVTCAV